MFFPRQMRSENVWCRGETTRCNQDDKNQNGSLLQCYVEIENKMQMMTQKRSGHEREGYAIFGTRRETMGRVQLRFCGPKPICKAFNDD